MISLHRSLRGRLLLGSLGVGISFAVVFGVGATWRVNDLENTSISAALTTRLELARDEVDARGRLTSDRSSPKTDLVQIIGPDGQVRSSTLALSGLPPLVDRNAALSRPEGVQSRVALEQPDIDLAALGVPLDVPRDGTSPAGVGVLVVAVDAEGFTTASTDLFGLLVVGLVAVIVGIAVLSWFLTGRTLRSVTLLTEEAESAGAEGLARGLPVPDRDAELARLVGALNRMLDRIEAGHAKELQFAADGGHRLRTPVAALRAEAELALSGDPADQVQALHRIVQDADHLTIVVNRMLRRIRGRVDSPEPVVAALVEAADRWTRQAGLADVDLQLALDPDVPETAVCPEVVDVTEPVVDNAIRHTPSGGSILITVSVGRDGDRPVLVVEVRDSGGGVDPDLASTIFDAWVSSRDASDAGGLGLWVARETARDLGGDVVLTRSEATNPGGGLFAISLPFSG